MADRDSLRSFGTYDPIAGEYYNRQRHPTCHALGLASEKLIDERLDHYSFDNRCVICDVGAGRSVLAKYVNHTKAKYRSLFILDRSAKMLAWSETLAPIDARLALIDADSISAIGQRFDLIVASLGDPYNTPGFWTALQAALVADGVCLFTTPSYEWARSFRQSCPMEVEDAALFELADGSRHYVPSLVYSEDEQVCMIQRAGLRIDYVRHAEAGDLAEVPPKMRHLDASTPIVTLFQIRRLK